jgi:hypothetical protein
MAGLSISPSTVRELTRFNERWSKKSARGSRRPQTMALPAGVILDGPFRTEAEVKKHIRLTILGPQCKVIEGGEWDPNWDSRND